MGTNLSTSKEDPSEAEENWLNSYNLTQHEVPRTSDVVVVGCRNPFLDIRHSSKDEGNPES
jgi:hypothetical protein